MSVISKSAIQTSDVIESHEVNNTIYTDKTDYNLLANGESIDIGGTKVGVELLTRIINNPEYYNYAYRFFFWTN